MTATSPSPSSLTSPLPSSNGENDAPEQEPNGIPPALTFTALRQHQTQMRAALEGSQDTTQLLAIATEQLRQIFSASRAVVYHFASETQGIVVAESVDRGWTPTINETLPTMFLGRDQAADYAEQGTVTIEYVATTEVTPYQLQLLEKYQVRSSLATPLVLGGELWGLLVVQQCDRARPWSDAEMLQLEQMSLIVAAALAQYDVQAELNAQQERDRVVNKVIERIRRSLDIKTIFQTATQELRQLLKADRVVLYRFNADWSGKYVAESVGGGWTSLMQTPPDEGLRQSVSADCSLQQMAERSADVRDTYLQDTQGGSYAQGNKFRVVPDIQEQNFPACYLELLEQMQAQAYLTVGVYQGDQLWGLLATYQCSGTRIWLESEIRLAGQIADQLGVALQQAVVIRQQRQQAERLEKALERERAIAAVSNKIKDSQDAASIFRTVTEEARKLLNSDRVGIYRFNADWSGDFIAESVGKDWRSLLRDPVVDDRVWIPGDIREELVVDYREDPLDPEGNPIPDARVRQLLSQDTYLQRNQGGKYARGETRGVCHDIYNSGFPDCFVELLETLEARAYIIVPIFLKQKLWGLIACYQCSGPRQWQEEEIQLMINLSAQLGIALQRAADMGAVKQRTQQLEKAVERERAIAAVTNKIKDSQDAATIFRTVTEEARKLLGSDRVGIYRFNEDWSGEFIAESVGSDWRSLLRDQVVDDRILAGTQSNIDTDGCTIKDMRVQKLVSKDTYLRDSKGGAYTKGDAARVCDDVYTAGFPPCYVELLESFQARAYVTVPIFLKDKLWGLMPCYQCAEARHWEPEEIQLLINLSSQLGIALQRTADLEAVKTEQQKLQKAVERERALAAVSESIKDIKDIDSIFRLATREARKLMDSDRVVVYRFNSDWSGVFVAESVGSGWVSLMGKQGEDPAILEGTQNNIDTVGCTIKNMRVQQLVTQDTYLRDTKGGGYRKGQAYRVCNDVEQSGFPDCYLELLESFQARAYVTVPVFLKDKLWGLMACYQCAAPRQWTKAETELMVRLSSQMGIALQRAADFEAVQSQTAKLKDAIRRERTLALVSDRIKQTENVEAIFKIATNEVRELLEADRVGIYRFNEDWSGEFVAESVVGQWKSLLREQIEDDALLEATKVNIDTEGCTIKRMATQDLISRDTYLERTQGGSYLTGDKYRACNNVDTAGFPRCYVELLERFQARAYVTVPIFLGDKLWGLMPTYQCSGPREWTEDEINLVVSLGSQLGIALQRAEDLAAVKAQAAKLEKSVERERAIGLLSDRIRQSPNVKSIFKSTTYEARKLFNSDRVAIYRFNPDWTGEFVAESVGSQWTSLLNAQVDEPSLLERTKLNIDTEGCTIQQMQIREMAAKDTYLQSTEGGTYRKGNSSRVCRDVYKANFPPCYLELLEMFQARAYITVPIFLGKRLWGLMANYQCSGPRNWEQAEIQLMVQLGSQLGIALQRSADLEKLRQQSQELEAAATREKAARQTLQKRAIELLSAVRPALEGDLTVRAPLSEDEMGTIADVYNNTLQSLRGIVVQVQDVTQRVAQTSQGSDSQIRQLADRAQQQSQELSQALAEVQKMVTSAQDVGTNAIAIEQAVQNANQTVNSGDLAMNRTVEGILAIRETVSEASQKIRELSESSQKIDRVVNLISDFATQTQLLSLNAAIEATRAGEYGKGFAVVADEVRSLARQSAGATLEISNLVAEIRQQTSEVIKVTEAAITQVSAGTSLVEETKGNLTAIAAATAQISTLVEGITSATTTQLEQSKSVTQTMRDVAEISTSTSSDSVQLSQAFQNTLETAQQLQAVVNQFKVD